MIKEFIVLFYKVDLEKNLLKKEASIKMGYFFKFMVYS
jgi:hypothetical protein